MSRPPRPTKDRTVSQLSRSLGYAVKRVQVIEVNYTTGTSVAKDGFGQNIEVALYPLRAKSDFPKVGEIWMIDKQFGPWSYAAVLSWDKPVDTGWVTDLDGFTAAANFTLEAVRYRILGDWVSLDCSMTRITSTLTNNTDGNPTNTSILSAIPAAIIPAQNQSISGPGADTSISSRMFGMSINADGTVSLLAMGGTTNLAINERVTFGGAYLLG